MGLLRRLTRERCLAVVLSTHDLELALRTADVIWLLVPGGDVIIGAPEDVMLSGAIAKAFEGRHIRFHPEDRGFRWLSGARGSATVNGHGVRADMARAVLEREGYAVHIQEAVSTVHVRVDDLYWTVSANSTDVSGETFRALGAHLRTLQPEHAKENDQ